MAVGFSPKFKAQLPLEGQDPKEILTLANEVILELGWYVGYIHPKGIQAYTKFSMSSWSEEFSLEILEDSIELKSECTGAQIMDWGKNKRNINRFIKSFTEKRSAYSSEELMQRFEKLEESELYSSDEILTGGTESSSFLDLFKPREGYFVTPILVYINLAIFILMVLSGANWIAPSGESLLMWGANLRPVTMGGDWWRLLTSCFVHIGLFHLLMNMYALLYIGLLLEPYLGRTKFIIAYVLTGVAASTTSLWWHELTISAGASGAIFGLYGLFLAMLCTNLIEKNKRRNLLTSIGIFVVYNLMNGLKGEIDNAAHIGGLLSGVVIGFALFPSLKSSTKNRLAFINLTAASLVIITAISLIANSVPKDLVEYDKKMEAFSNMENMALEIYSLPNSTTDEELLNAIRSRGIYYWNENRKLLEQVALLDLPENLQEQNLRLMEYCDLRLKSYRLIYKAVSEDTEAYQDSLDQLYLEIEQIIDDLKQE